jgi:adenylate cyclase
VLILAFTLLVAVAAAVPLALSERALSAMRRTQVAQQFALVSSGVRSRFDAQFGSTNVVLDTLTTGFPSETADEAAAIRLARVLSDLRETSSIALTILLAKEDGSFSLARALTPADRGRAQAAGAGEAAFEIQTGAPRDGTLRDAFAYLDARFRVLARTPPRPVDYDSRQRPWYRLAQATDRAVVTPPYRFQDDPFSGVTLSRRGGASGRDVFGIDVTLDDLSGSLRDSIAFDGEQISIIQDDGWLVADSAVTALPLLMAAGPAGDARCIGPSRPDAGATGCDDAGAGAGDPQRSRGAAAARVAAVYRAFRSDPQPRALDLDLPGGRVLATFATLRFDNRTFLIASTLPYAVFDEPVMRWLRWVLGFECAVVVLALLLALQAARAMSGPIMALASDVEHIVAFRGARSPRRRSRLREIGRLSEAVDTLELALTAFALYTPLHLVKGIVERGTVPDLGGSKRDVVVMFSDIDGFTALAEDVAPVALTVQLSRHLAAIADEVVASGGTVDKFIGDSVMAFWDGEGAAAAACGAALAAQARIASLNAAFAAEGLPAMWSRFGLHRGEAMLGNVGTPGRMSYTVLGHAVNVASRIEALNKEHGTTVLVSDAVVAAAEDALAFRHVADAVVRGARASVGLYEPLPARAAHP